MTDDWRGRSDATTQADAPAKPIGGAAIATVIACAILIALGMWQLRRLHWKESLIVRIDAAEQAPPVPLGPGTPPLFTRVRVHGTLRAEHLALFGADVRGMHMGAQAIQLLDRPGNQPLLVVLGWVSTDGAAPRPLTGEADITGYIRLPDPPGWLSASDDLEGRHFYALNPSTIAASLGAADAAPFMLVALGPPAPSAQPQPADALPRPVNNHLQYALTWFGLAASLMGVFVAWVRQQTK